MTEISNHSSATSFERPSKVSKTLEPNNGEEEDHHLHSNSAPQSMSPNPRIQRYLVAIEYIGTRFFGSQQQPIFRTVTGVLEEAFSNFTGQPISVMCSSRTDAGVHALSNVCHVDIERISKRKPGEMLPPHEPIVVKRAVNHFLKKEGDVMVIDVREVPSNFHARYRATERTYFYRLLSGPEAVLTFEKDRAWHVAEELNLQNMQEACKILVGCHDFSSFRASGCEAKSPIRSLDELTVIEMPSSLFFPSIAEREQKSSNREDPRESYSSNENSFGFGARRRHVGYVVTARSRSFLYHQVRLLVGLLKCVGTGESSVSDVEKILNAKTVTAAKPMAPACGLYLGHVNYDLPAE